MKYFFTLLLTFSFLTHNAQVSDPLTIDRLYASSEFRQERLAPFQWLSNQDAYIEVKTNRYGKQFIYKTSIVNDQQTLLVGPDQLTPNNQDNSLYVEDIIFSKDETKLLLFTNTSRVWRDNTKGDYWVFDLTTKKLRQIGASLEPSSLMFAKFSDDNSKVAYVHNFNVYVEGIESGVVTPLTDTGGNGIINGTFDWAYEEEFNCRDGFRWNPSGQSIAFWNIDASSIGTFYMINNTDDVYSNPIPLQYPKVGDDPSAAKVGVVSLNDNKVSWIPVPGNNVQNYLPGMQWVDEDLLLIQQINRHQNHLKIWSYRISNQSLKLVYEEKEDTWVDIKIPDVSNRERDENILKLVENNQYFLRFNEVDGWRHIYKINIKTGKKTLLTPGNYDAATLAGTDKKYVYYHASPSNSTQRYLYRSPLNGKGTSERLTPSSSEGINKYKLSPNGTYALHTHSASLTPETIDLIRVSDHKEIRPMVENKRFTNKINSLKLPKIDFLTVTTTEGIDIDAQIIKPIDFDPNKKYPVVFYVYGEPWKQVAVDQWMGMWNIYLAQLGYVVINMDNRGTPCLKGSQWRKSIYRNIGIINTFDQGQAAKEILKLPYLDDSRTAVWGWSGGGSLTMNLMFKYPEIYTTGIAVAGMSNQLIYDNIYQERYMGLPQENLEDFINGSPLTHAKGLEGNLLLIHGTGDDNVHYQSLEMLANELIKHNKQFDMMAYPNRSHGIYEGRNTQRHLYTLIRNYLLEHVPLNN